MPDSTDGIWPSILSKQVTGKVFLRQAADATAKDLVRRTPDGRRVMIVLGVVAVPEDFPFACEHQHSVLGTPDGQMTILSKTAIDRKELAKNLRFEQLLYEPIWKV